MKALQLLRSLTISVETSICNSNLLNLNSSLTEVQEQQQSHDSAAVLELTLT